MEIFAAIAKEKEEKAERRKIAKQEREAKKAREIED